MTNKNKLLFLVFYLLITSVASGHGGGLNSSGCHNNRKTGDYHCHRASYTPDPTPVLNYRPTKKIFSYNAPQYKVNNCRNYVNKISLLESKLSNLEQLNYQNLVEINLLKAQNEHLKYTDNKIIIRPQIMQLSSFVESIGERKNLDSYAQKASELKNELVTVKEKYKKEIKELRSFYEEKISSFENKKRNLEFTPKVIAKKDDERSNKTIKIGMHRIKIRKIQGAPIKVKNTKNSTIWFYKDKRVYFSKKNNRVIKTTYFGRNKTKKTKLTLSSLSFEEKGSIEYACINFYGKGAANYRRCINKELKLLENSKRMPSLNHLPYKEISSIKYSCITDYGKGASVYNLCIIKQLKELEGVESNY